MIAFSSLNLFPSDDFLYTLHNSGWTFLNQPFEKYLLEFVKNNIDLLSNLDGGSRKKIKYCKKGKRKRKKIKKTRKSKLTRKRKQSRKRKQTRKRKSK